MYRWCKVPHIPNWELNGSNDWVVRSFSQFVYSSDTAPDIHWIQRSVTDITDGSHVFEKKRKSDHAAWLS